MGNLSYYDTGTLTPDGIPVWATSSGNSIASPFQPDDMHIASGSAFDPATTSWNVSGDSLQKYLDSVIDSSGYKSTGFNADSLNRANAMGLGQYGLNGNAGNFQLPGQDSGVSWSVNPDGTYQTTPISDYSAWVNSHQNDSGGFLTDFMTNYGPLVVAALATAGSGVGALGADAANGAEIGSYGMSADPSLSSNSFLQSLSDSGIGTQMSYDPAMSATGVGSVTDPALASSLAHLTARTGAPFGLTDVVAKGSRILDNVASNPQSVGYLANALSNFTNSPVMDIPGAGSSVSSSNGVNSTDSQTTQNNGILTNPTTQEFSMNQTAMPQQNIGLIDPTSAQNAMLQAGSTWNGKLANALRRS